MRIGIDATSLLYSRGVSRYTSNLMRSLALLPNTSVSAFGASFRQRSHLKRLITTISPKISDVVVKPWPVALTSKLWTSGHAPVSQYLPSISVFHSWDWIQPPPMKIPTVTTIHDLAMLRFPDTAHPTILKAHQRSWKQIKQQNMHVIAISHSTKRDIINFLEIDPQRVHVVYEALPTEVMQSAASLDEEYCQSVLQQLRIDTPFFLFVGTDEPRKNLQRVVQAWQEFAADYALVIAGASGWSASDYTSFTHQPTFVGQITDTVLSALYAEALLFLYPSLYEGFGLPILEAFHHGTPVITSSNSGMKEVAGNAAELINPESVEELTHAIKRIVSESPTDQKNRDQRMIIRLQMFDWTTCAIQTRAVYEQAIQEYNL